MKYLLPILSIFMMSCDPDCPLGAERCRTERTIYPEVCYYGDFTNQTTVSCEPCEDFFDRTAETDEEWEEGCSEDEWHELCYSTADYYEDCERLCEFFVLPPESYDECIVVD